MTLLSPAIEVAKTLLSAPIELAGDWGHMIPRAADQVVERMRHACLDGVRLLSDRQPTRLRVHEHASGSPACEIRNNTENANKIRRLEKRVRNSGPAAKS